MNKNKLIELFGGVSKDIQSIEAELTEAQSAVYEENVDGLAASIHAIWWRANELNQRIDMIIKESGT